MAKDIYRGPLEQVDACCWRIPREYKEGMRVDGLIFANEPLMEQITNDQAPEQVANVAFLPGIQVASLAMPDIHWGYGFCIGGVCATDPDEGGVISPGGVGYDINCLTGDSRVLDEHGCTRPIGELAKEWSRLNLACCDLGESGPRATEVVHWFGQKPRSPVLQLVTEAGDEIRGTADHPFWTADGMIPLGKLKVGDRVARWPFEGVPHEEPANTELVSEADFRARWLAQGLPTGGKALEQTIDFLHSRDLLPLSLSSRAIPYLCKVLGFLFGDGNLHFSDKMGVVHFYGEADDLESIRTDLTTLGITPSRIYKRLRNHQIQTAYSLYTFDREENSMKVVGSGFAVLLACLGTPVGNKTRQGYDLPPWLDESPLWLKRLFLAGLFGAELTTPATITGHDTVFGAPTLSMNKRAEHVGSGRRFLKQLSSWLSAFGVCTQGLHEDMPREIHDGEASCRLRLVLSPRSESLLALWNRIGYVYNQKRTRQAALAVQYLKLKERHLTQRAEITRTVRALAEQGVARSEIFAQCISSTTNCHLVERALYSPRPPVPRVAQHFPTFSEFCASASLGQSGMVWDRVAQIEPVEDFTGKVYDFTVRHHDHNFVANGFVVSNCGVRLVRSNLFYQEVKPHLRTLIDHLFRSVPTGVGRSGKYKFDKKELNHLLSEGSRYLQGRGFATPGDIAHTEAEGRLDGADPSAVSDRALERGSSQCGTLGSGNHFLEVQVVDHVFDEDAAQVMGLEKDMVCVMIHSGSRGLGYQVCDDALKMLRKAPQKYGIDLPDRQLACAPVDSPEGQKYIAAMRAAANFAWCNRQLLMHQAREVFEEVFGTPWQRLQMNLVYDVCHNIAKFEEHAVGNQRKKLWVHRKGATRAFPPGHNEVPAIYRGIGQPVLIPGDMGRASWVLAGQAGSMERSFGTTCHGAGRAMSRTASVKNAAGRRIDKELESRGVIARAQSRKGLAEEQSAAYKNVDDVVEVVDQAGLSKKVARMRPLGVIKG